MLDSGLKSLDEIDKKLLAILKDNSRASFKSISKEITENLPEIQNESRDKFSDVSVRKRIKKLQDSGIINKFTINIDPQKLGYHISAFMGFDAEPEYYNHIVEQLLYCEMSTEIDLYIDSIFQTSVDHDFMIWCSFKDNDALTKFQTKLMNTQGITKVCPAIINQKIR